MDRLCHVALRFETDHLVEATVKAGVQECRCSCLNIEDGLANLLKSVLALISHEVAQTTTKWPYSGRTWWIFDRDGPDLYINLLEFDETPFELPSGHWVAIELFRCVALSARTTMTDFVEIIVKDFDRIQAALGDMGFRNEWGYNFPHKDIEALRQWTT